MCGGTRGGPPVVQGAPFSLPSLFVFPPPSDAVCEALQAFIAERGYPCIMAKSILRRDQFVLGTYPRLGPSAVGAGLARDLARFARSPEPERGFRSFVAVFGGEPPPSEEAFEDGLWATLRALHAADGAAWDPAVSADPAHPEFSFSFAGRAFYPVGMHPNASRPARRFAYPMIAFNLHEQFERLRREGRYERIRGLIRERDRAFSGSVNPMVEDFGERSEARQYTGRAVGSDWRCPFHAAPLAASYVLPLKARTPQDGELTGYLRRLVRFVDDVIVVDGSPPEVFTRHAEAWAPLARHLRPEVTTPMGKVGNVLIGLRHARHERVVIADDDVRYDETTLRRAVALLGEAEVVRPQNVFRPRPWHARWDTGRTLLNRLAGGDWPGTLAVRRSALEATGGYRGDVLFENLELVRTVQAAGGREAVPLDLFVERRPPSTRHFLSQRVRQAYDEWARPGRFAAQLAVLPTVAALAARGRWRALGASVLGTVAVAEVGRRRAGGRRVFAPTAALWAPLWVAERTVTSWLALGTRLVRGGVRYGGNRLRDAATPLRVLRRRHGGCIRSSHPNPPASCPVSTSPTRLSGSLARPTPTTPASAPTSG